MPEQDDQDAIGLGRLSALSGAQRAKVRDALKATLDQQLVGTGILSGGGLAQTPMHEKESGPLHGKDFSREPGRDLDMISQISGMDEVAFKQLAVRLTALRGDR